MPEGGFNTFRHTSATDLRASGANRTWTIGSEGPCFRGSATLSHLCCCEQLLYEPGQFSKSLTAERVYPYAVQGKSNTNQLLTSVILHFYILTATSFDMCPA